MNMTIQSIKDFSHIASNKELSEALAVLNKEVRARNEAERKRSEWVGTWLLKYLSHPNATAKVIGTDTVVALYNRSFGVQIATARCMPGDTYDYDTGVAVAFAKLSLEPIPDYI